ncbi:LuxR C-terminal-related transcriptional regulator [Micromonospora parva]|uniref:response regulator transcription factor n=1 Tax=Micromonospora parva TaxID=1464048 RepID=UPI0033D9DAB3
MSTATATRPVLTDEQLALLTQVADGRTNLAIARRVGLSRSSVENRLSALYRQIGARNAPHAVAIAIRSGLLPTHPAPEGQA